MTTVVVSREGMAADSWLTDDFSTFSVQKIWRLQGIDGEILVGVSGRYDKCLQFVDWMDDKGDVKMRHVQAITLDAEGISIYDGSKTPLRIRDPFAAIGSGAQAALGALHAGAGLAQAIEIARLIDPATGGMVVTELL